MRRLYNEVCKICSKQIKSFFNEHNAHPVAQGRCCELCNSAVVIPARIKKMQEADAN